MKKSLGEIIERDPAICGGEPVFKGTRVRLKIVLDNLAEGVSPEDIVHSYPTLTLEDVYCAIAFAAASAADDLSLPLDLPVIPWHEIQD